MLKEFKTLNFEDKEIQLLQDSIEQYVSQLTKYPSLAFGSEDFRLPRPAYKSNSTSTTQIIIPGSSLKPSVFFINGTVYRVTQNLICDFTLNGAGGLDTGVVAANTVYYLYGVLKNGIVFPIASINAPTTAGPKNFSTWTYIGACVTLASGLLALFVSSKGRYLTTAQIDQQQHNADTNLTAKTIISPITTKVSLGQLIVTGSVVNNVVSVCGFNDGTAANLSVLNLLQVNGGQINMFCEVALDNPNTIYLKTQNVSNIAYWRVNGWQEDPTEYP